MMNFFLHSSLYLNFAEDFLPIDFLIGWKFMIIVYHVHTVHLHKTEINAKYVDFLADYALDNLWIRRKKSHRDMWPDLKINGEWFLLGIGTN